MQTPLQLDIWLQSYEGFDNAKNNMKQRNFNTVYSNISKTTSPTSDSFLLIMSQFGFRRVSHEAASNNKYYENKNVYGKSIMKSSILDFWQVNKHNL